MASTVPSGQAGSSSLTLLWSGGCPSPHTQRGCGPGGRPSPESDFMERGRNLSFTSLGLFSRLDAERQTGLDADGKALSPRQSEEGLSQQGLQTPML